MSNTNSPFRILIPTDFSKCSVHAVQYALFQQQALHAEIILFHAVYLPGANYAVHMDAEVHDSLLDEAEKQLESMAAKLETEYNANVITKAIYNVPAMAVKEYLEKEPCDMVVIGTRGASGFKKIFIGTHASEIAENSPVPVLIVPEKAAFSTINRILYASDMDDLFNEVADILPFARLFNAQLDIIHVLTRSMPVQKEKDEELSKELREKYSCRQLNFTSITSPDVIKGIDDYMEENPVDVLAMFYRKKGILRKLFEKSQTTTMAYSTKIPLLTFKKW